MRGPGMRNPRNTRFPTLKYHNDTETRQSRLSPSPGFSFGILKFAGPSNTDPQLHRRYSLSETNSRPKDSMSCGCAPPLADESAGDISSLVLALLTVGCNVGLHGDTSCIKVRVLPHVLLPFYHIQYLCRLVDHTFSS